MDFNLEKFLSDYKPKVLDLSPYLKLDKLKGYQTLERKNMANLIPQQTYIKYMKMADAYKDRDLKSHVRGGILVAGGTFVNGKFVKSDDDGTWTHLILRFAPFPTAVTRSKKGFGHQKIYEHETHLFFIKINDYYLFYKYFQPK